MLNNLHFENAWDIQLNSRVLEENGYGYDLDFAHRLALIVFVSYKKWVQS